MDPRRHTKEKQRHVIPSEVPVCHSEPSPCLSFRAKPRNLAFDLSSALRFLDCVRMLTPLGMTSWVSWVVRYNGRGWLGLQPCCIYPGCSQKTVRSPAPANKLEIG